MNDRDKTLNVISLFVAIASLLIPAVFFIISATDKIQIQSLIIFGIMVASIIIFSVIYFVYQIYKRELYDIEINKKDIFEIRKSLNSKKLFDDMDVRIKVLERLTERKNKRAQIDPRIVWIIVMLILLYLFLKSIGILP